jgi:UDP-N-acetylglucosamine--N-acetylmuramyl-(pentapeptide) pyrophosphoryl-undecaprenol N-acetylglucosamine transferase
MTTHLQPGVSRHFVLAAGGTGGHLIPAFALATELHRRGHHVALITDARGAKIPGKPEFLTAHVLPAGRLGKNPVALFKGLRAIWQGRAMALRLFESFQPACVIGFGGYPALPALLAARAARIPTVIHEQNAVLGRVNRYLAKNVDAIATAYHEVDRLEPRYAGKVHLVGNPVRPEVLALRGQPFPEFTEDSLFRVLVTGGSQGLRSSRKWCPMAWPCCPLRCVTGFRSPSSAARKTLRPCARAMPPTRFPPNWAPISRTWPAVWPMRTCSWAARVLRRLPN